ncbi:MAG: CDP-glucose 4,6-dehydratase [Proteobacteria bacterium]|nr:MAG: CDP-glucose 4,6-dehydratase [Pseudomonadota bacterium]
MARAAALNREFWQGRRVLLTGHTGFKGAWTAAMLVDLGATVTGIALAPDSEPNLWALFDGRLAIDSAIGDLRDLAATREVCRRARPEIVVHMAAQALVPRGYRLPAETFSSNLIGTVNLLEALRGQDAVETLLVVTSDKVYRNKGDDVAFKEDGELGGSDPYSASKAAAELIVRSYAESFFDARGVPVATARGGNVLGGGDFAPERLLPDVFRAAQEKRAVTLRYPHARRPWQHVLDCICGYLRYAEHLHGQGRALPPALNFGPLDGGGHMTVAEIAQVVGRRLGNAIPWEAASTEFAPEKQQLRLNCRLAKEVLGWSPRLGLNDTLDWTAEWYAAFAKGGDPLNLVRGQIERYLRGGE